MYIGENLKRIRKERGMTQEQLAERAGLVVMSIRRYENENANSRYEALKKISQALNISVKELIGEEYNSPAELPADVKKLLNRYRELYDEEQQYNEEHYNIPFKQLSDNVLLMIALDEAIAKIHLERAEERKRGGKDGMCKI